MIISHWCLLFGAAWLPLVIPFTISRTSFISQSTSPAQIRNKDVQMHIGHSHDHYHNHLSNPNPAPSEFLSQLRNPKNYLKHPRGRAILIASTVLLLSCAVRKRIAKIDVIIFSLFATSLSAFDIFKSGAKMWISRMQILREGIAKHSTPINSNYLFKNQNLADRVTLLGVGINVVLSISKFLGGLGEPIYFVITRSLLT